jgi:hypothetical protein
LTSIFDPSPPLCSSGLLAGKFNPDAKASWRRPWLRRARDGFVVQAVVPIPLITLLAELILRTIHKG